MKRVLLTLVALILVGSSFAATPAKQVVTENFKWTGAAFPGTRIDANVNAEAIKVMDADGSGFAWGASSANTTGGGILLNNTGTDSIVFKTIPTTGTYAYTRFSTAVADVVPSKIVDATTDGSKIELISNQQLGGTDLTGPVDVSVMIRDNTGWFVSNTVQTIPAVATATTYTYVLVGTGATTWLTLTGTTDMDEVDDGGDSPLATIGAAGTPNLGAIEGMGIMLRTTGTGGDLRIQSMILTGAGGVTGVNDWMEW